MFCIPNYLNHYAVIRLLFYNWKYRFWNICLIGSVILFTNNIST